MPWTQLLFSLDGRISRREFWLRYVMPLCLGLMAAMVLLPVEFFFRPIPYEYARAHPFAWIAPGAWLMIVVVYWFTIVCGVKRYHDRDRTGWFLLLYLLPAIGPLWVWIELGFLRGTAGPNRYGGDPLART